MTAALVPIVGERSLLDVNVTSSSVVAVAESLRLAATTPTATTTAAATANEPNSSRLLTVTG